MRRAFVLALSATLALVVANSGCILQTVKDSTGVSLDLLELRDLEVPLDAFNLGLDLPLVPGVARVTPLDLEQMVPPIIEENRQHLEQINEGSVGVTGTNSSTTAHGFALYVTSRSDLNADTLASNGTLLADVSIPAGTTDGEVEGVMTQEGSEELLDLLLADAPELSLYLLIPEDVPVDQVSVSGLSLSLNIWIAVYSDTPYDEAILTEE